MKKIKNLFKINPKKVVSMGLILGMSFSLCACVPNNGENNKKDNKHMDNALNNVTDDEKEAIEQLSLNKVTYPQKSENCEKNDDEFKESVNSFASKTANLIFNSEDNKNKNINYSPISVYLAMSLLTNGSEKQTYNQLNDLLGVTNKDKQYISDENKKLFDNLYNDEKNKKLLIANSLWMNKGANFSKDYLKDAQNNFYSELFSIDLGKQDDVNLIGKWVSKNTNNLLNPTFKAKKEAMLYIINTIYYKSAWRDQFIKNFNKTEDFNISDNQKVDCDYMTKEKTNYSYIKGNNYIGSELYLNNGKMYFVLPDENVNVYDLISTNNKFKSLLDDYSNNDNRQRADINFYVPKFTIKSEIVLNDYFKALGCSDMFDHEKCDLTSIIKSNKNTFVSLVKQQNYIDVNEEGIEAAAYTQAECGVTSMPPQNLQKIDFKLNRPFIYFLMSNDNTVLFVGICNNPTEK